jgi:hypothetical protein
VTTVASCCASGMVAAVEDGTSPAGTGGSDGELMAAGVGGASESHRSNRRFCPCARSFLARSACVRQSQWRQHGCRS